MKSKNGRRERKLTTRRRVQRRQREWRRRVLHECVYVRCESYGLRLRVCVALTARTVTVNGADHSRDRRGLSFFFTHARRTKHMH
jgi:hypothetical protein